MVDLVCCGAINWDINLFMGRLPRTGEEVPVHEIQRVSGGTAANVAVAAARILGPGRVAFLGALGGDDIAERQLAILDEEKVDASAVLRALDDPTRQEPCFVARVRTGEQLQCGLVVVRLQTHVGPNPLSRCGYASNLMAAETAVLPD